MSANRLWSSLLLGLVCTSAGAGPVYKIVGPDGKVTFSDKPPVEATSAAYQVVGGRSGAEAIASSGSPANAAGAELRAASGTEPKAAAPADTPIRSAPSVAIEGAIRGVLGIEDIVKRTEAVCIDTLPTSSEQYGAATKAWQSRNGAVVARARELLASEFDAGEQSAVAAGLRAKNDGMFAAVQAASTAARVSWCDESFATMNGGTMDVHDNLRLAGPLAAR
jgi:hypothetical protein